MPILIKDFNARMKRQASDWENTSAMHILLSHKGLSRIYEHLQINKKMTTLQKNGKKSYTCTSQKKTCK